MKNYYDERKIMPVDIGILRKIAKPGIQLADDSIISRVRFKSNNESRIKSFCVNFESFVSSEEEIPFLLDGASAMVFDIIFKFHAVNLICKKDKRRLVIDLVKDKG